MSRTITSTAGIAWSLGQSDFSSGRYNRSHIWIFDGGIEVPASASPHIVRPPYADPSAVDPEEAFVAALSSCHMLLFLSVAANEGLVVRAYSDQAKGTLEMGPDGGRITGVNLRPKVVWGGTAPSPEQLENLHAKAHAACFLARSVSCDVTWDSESPGDRS